MRSACKRVDILLSLVVLWQFMLHTAKNHPLDGGYGGVFNSPEANAYWARRFGTGFLKSSSSRNLNTKNKNFNRYRSSIPSFRLREADRKNLYNPLEENLHENRPDTKNRATGRIKVDLIQSSSTKKDAKTSGEKGIANFSTSSELDTPKREKNLNRSTSESNSLALKRKYLKKYFSGKNS